MTLSLDVASGAHEVVCGGLGGRQGTRGGRVGGLGKAGCANACWPGGGHLPRGPATEDDRKPGSHLQSHQRILAAATGGQKTRE